MKKNTVFVLRNLSALTFFMIYLVMVVILLFLESFIQEDQLNLVIVMVPCILVGILLDYIISRNEELPKGYKIFTQLLPASSFAFYGLVTIFSIAGNPLDPKYYYIIWLVISAPFMIASYHKKSHNIKLISSIIGTALVFAAYLYLTTLTDELVVGNGLVIFIISYFMILYSASGIRKMPYISSILGLLNAGILIYMYKSPASADALVYGWDYDFSYYFELLMLFLFCISVLIGVIAARQEKLKDTAHN